MTPSARRRADHLIFITGTDTGVGKTLLTGLLLRHLRESGVHALAMKPFCCGDRADVKLLYGLQEGELDWNEINPFFFAEPVAPLVASRFAGRQISCTQVVTAIRNIAARYDRLLIEGVGGLLAPLGEKFSMADVITRLEGQVIVVSRNRLGTINHTLLTVAALRHAGIRGPKVVMMEARHGDCSSRSNVLIVSDLLRKVPVFSLPDFGSMASRIAAVKKNQKKMRKTLARILE